MGPSITLETSSFWWLGVVLLESWAEVPAGGALWSHSSHPITCTDNLFGCLLFFSAQSSSFPVPSIHSVSLFQFNKGIEHSKQAEMPANGEGIIFSAHVSVSRYTSTCGVNLAWRSRAGTMPGNMKCSSVRQKWWNATWQRPVGSQRDFWASSSQCHYEADQLYKRTSHLALMRFGLTCTSIWYEGMLNILWLQ